MSISDIKNKYNNLSVQLKASIWFLFCAFLQKGVSALTTPIFARLLSTDEYGEYNVFNSWLSIITCIVTLNLYGGMYSQGLVKHNGKQRDVFSSSLQGLTLFLSFIWLIIYIPSRQFWNQLFHLTTLQMLLMFIIIWSTSVYNFWAVDQRVGFKYKKLVVITLIASVLNPLLGVLFIILFPDNVTARILGTAVAEVSIYFSLFVSQMKKGKVFFSKENWKYALCFCLPLVPHYLSQVVLNCSDRIMIQYLVNDSAAGIYSLAYSVSLIMSLFNTALLQTIEPWIYIKIKSNMTNDIKKVAYPAFLVIASVNLLLIALAPEVVFIFAPVEYYEAIWAIPPVTISVYFMFMYSFFALFEFYFEKTHYITIATITGAALNILLNYVCINIFGYIAAGYTTLFCYIVYSLMHYIFMRKVIKEKLNNINVYNIKIIALISISFMILAFLLMFTYSYPFLRYLFLIIIGIIVLIFRKKIVNTLSMIIQVKKRQI